MAGPLDRDNAIEALTADRTPHYEPMGWHHWSEHPWLSYQFRRGLGETQEGGGSVSEIFLAASRMVPGDLESWHEEALRGRWTSPAVVKARYRSASICGGNRVVFNIGGNKYRLVVETQYRAEIVWVKFIGTHAQYDRIDVETVNDY